MPILKDVKRLLRSVVYGTLMQAFAIYLMFMMNFSDKGDWLLWNVSLGALLAGPMPQVGHTVDGRPVYEPMGIHFIMGLVGLALGVATYSALVYLGLRAFGRRQAR